jgi:translation initiation factor IF-3
VRINDRIRVREVRVIDENGQQLGIMAPAQAVAIARQRGLDLVEVSPTAVPPVCRITDYGKYQYTEQKRARQARKHQKTILVKEIKFRPKVDEHDYDFKKKHIERFIEDGDKVKAVIFFRGREIAHPEIGRRILERLISEVSEVAVAENMPRMEGNSMHVILGPRPGAGAPKKPAPSSAEGRGPQAQQRRAPEPAQATQSAASQPAAPERASAAPVTADEKS